MIRIALVGSIGSGKTYVPKLFGYPVFNADESVSKIYRKNKSIFNKLKKKIPNSFSKFPIKKEELINAIIKNKINIKKISSIVHPEVRKDLQKFLKKNYKKKIVILDVPLFLENKLNKKNDIIVFINSSNKESFEKVRKRKNYNSVVHQMLKKFQLPISVKKKKANYIIKNNFKKNSLKKELMIY
tara:strand:- start:293 stop:847 length:555 start_codon:yes stop_codon:yes gene_type:complete